jgi:hypothetical protein
MRKFLYGFGKLLVKLAVVYAILSAALFVVMIQPLERFSAVMARLPGPVFALLPFKPLWDIARGGDLRVGDPAPDFDLEVVPRAEADEAETVEAVTAELDAAAPARVQLASFRGKRPVLLVFGSYT